MGHPSYPMQVDNKQVQRKPQNFAAEESLHKQHTLS